MAVALLAVGSGSHLPAEEELGESEAKAILLNKLPDLFKPLIGTDDLDKIVEEQSTIKVCRDIVPGFNVIFVLEKSGQRNGFHGAFLYDLGTDTLTNMSLLDHSIDPVSLKRLWHKEDESNFDCVYLFIRTQSGFGRYAVIFYHLSKPVGKRPVLEQIPFYGWLAMGDLGDFIFEPSSKSVVYQTGKQMHRLLRIEESHQGKVDVKLHPDASLILKGSYRISLPPKEPVEGNSPPEHEKTTDKTSPSGNSGSAPRQPPDGHPSARPSSAPK